MDAASSVIPVDLPGIEEKDGLPVEAFAKVQEIFNSVDWLDSNADVAMNVLQQIKASNILQTETSSPQKSKQGSKLSESTLEEVEANSKIMEETGNHTPTNQAKQAISLINHLPADAIAAGK